MSEEGVRISGISEKGLAIVQLMTYPGWEATLEEMERDWPGPTEATVRDVLDEACGDQLVLVKRTRSGYAITDEERGRKGARLLAAITLAVMEKQGFDTSEYRAMLNLDAGRS